MSLSPLFPERVREPRFRVGKQRRVDHAPNFADRTGQVIAGSKAEQDLIALIKLLGDGSILPERFYRNGIDRDADQLLDDHGIKHLHLDHATSDIVLFLVEYDDSVLLLEINDHSAFAEKPVGSILRALHQSALTAADKTSATDTANRIAAKAAAAKAGLLPRRPRSSGPVGEQ